MRAFPAALVLAGLVALAGCSGGNGTTATTADTTADSVGATTSPPVAVTVAPPADTGPVETVVPGTHAPDLGAGGELPLPGGYRPAAGLSAQCETALGDIRTLLAENPDPFQLPEDVYAELDAARTAAFGETACSAEEWAEFNTSELSPWAAGQYPAAG